MPEDSVTCPCCGKPTPDENLRCIFCGELLRYRSGVLGALRYRWRWLFVALVVIVAWLFFRVWT